MHDEVMTFLEQSNFIEEVRDAASLKQAKYAWDYLVDQPELTNYVVLKTHKILMLHQPLQPDQKGYYRKVQVWVGNREGVDHKEIIPKMQNWLFNNMMVKNIPKDQVEDYIKKLHVQYEHIHPFVDGNGRTGRMFMNYARINAGLPILVIWDKEKQEYYQWFK